MADSEKAYEAVEKLAQTTRGSYETLIGYAVELQERNATFVRGVLDAAVREYRGQAEANRAVARELAKRAGEQRHAFRVVAEESHGAYRDVLYAPLAYHKEGLQQAAPAGDANEGFPIPNYDDLTVEEVSGK